MQEAPTFDPTVMKKKKPRKSVAFEGAENGNGEDGDLNGEDKTTAQRHSLSMSELLSLTSMYHFLFVLVHLDLDIKVLDA